MSPVRFFSLLFWFSSTPFLQGEQPFSGIVREVIASERSLIVEPAPEMSPEFQDPLTVRVNPGDLEVGYVGKLIEGRLLKSAGAWRLETIWPREPVQEQIMEDVNTQLRRDTATRGRRMVRLAGDHIPNFALYNEDGELVQSVDLRGELLVLNFIFTRCPIPTMCPANTTRMARLQRELADRGMEGIHLISISLDPEYDTPGIMRYYAESRGLDLENFSFLSGPKPVVDDILRQFGILTMEKDGTIDHTMATLIIDQNGKIVHRKDGSRWSVEDFLKRLEGLKS